MSNQQNDRRIVQSHTNINPDRIILSMFIDGEAYNAFLAAGAQALIVTPNQAAQRRDEIIADARAQGITPTGARKGDPSAVDSGAAQMKVYKCAPAASIVHDLKTVGYTLTVIEAVHEERNDRCKLRLHFSREPAPEAPKTLVNMAARWLTVSWDVCHVWHNPHKGTVTFNCDSHYHGNGSRQLRVNKSGDGITISTVQVNK